jgi:hypothetical protein
VFYIDDIRVHSRSFEKHLVHLNTVTGELDEMLTTDVYTNCGMSIAENRKRSKAKFGLYLSRNFRISKMSINKP